MDIINTSSLKHKYPMFQRYDKDFNLIPIPPMAEGALENFETNVTNEFTKIKEQGYAYFSYNSLGGLENYKMVVLRNHLDFTDILFTTFNEFCESVGKNIIIYDNSESSNISSEFYTCDGKFYYLSDLYYQYLAQAYFGFIKEHRIKIILASHPRCISGEFNLYRSDTIGDLNYKNDLFVFRNRPQRNSLGFWKTIGVGSKTTKNITEENCSIVIHNAKDSLDNGAIPGTWIYVRSKESIYKEIDDLLAL